MKYLYLLSIVLFPNNSFAQKSEVDIISFMNLVLNYSNDYKLNQIHKEINKRTLYSDMNIYKYSLNLTLQPQVNHSISGVTQPDGSVRNHNLLNYSVAPTINFSMPLTFIGGTINATSNLNYYETNTSSLRTKSFSADIFHISYTQAFHKYNSVKWGMKTARATFWLSNYDNATDYIQLKSKACSEYIEVVKNRMLLKQYIEQLKNLEDIEGIYQKLYKHGQIIKIELNELITRKLEIEDKIKYDKLNLEYSTRNLNCLINNFLDMDSVMMPTPNIIKILDYASIFNLLKKKQNEYDTVACIPFQKSVIEASNNRGVQLSLTTGAGINSSANHFSELLEKKVPTFNISVSAKIPISDFKEKENQYKLAKLQLKQFGLSYREKMKEEEDNVEQLITKYNYLITSLELVNKKEKYLEEEVVVKRSLLLSKKILFTSYIESSQKITENEQDKISYIQEIYNCLFKIESLTMHDFISDTDYYDTFK